MAVQVSGVHLAGVEIDPEPLRGIKTFVRDILPCQTHASPEGGTTPVLCDPGFEDTQCDNSHLKRKSRLVEDESADSTDSDSEHRPSSKRQRITVSAMRRLFAKFSISDIDETSQPVTLGESSKEASAPIDTATTPQNNTNQPPTPESDTERSLDENRAQRSSSPNRSSPVTVRTEKRISETDSNEEHGDKRQRTSIRQSDSEGEDKPETQEKNKEKDKENSEGGETDKTVATASEDASKNNKRQADTRESDTEDKEKPGNKVKRTRRLRRGLRLCTNITCYIEQVLYN